MRLGRVMLGVALLGVACTLTPIPDLTSNWSEPCDTSLRRCPVEFTLQAGAEKTVELRGDFRADGWDAGEPMTKAGATWSATVPVPWGAAVQYKYFIDGSRWIVDPGNPKTVRDNEGNTNSLIENVVCGKWTCAPAAGP